MPEISLISVDHEVISKLCKQAKLYFSDNPASIIFEDLGTDTKIVRTINQQGQDTYYQRTENLAQDLLEKFQLE